MISTDTKASLRQLLGQYLRFRPNYCYGQDGEDLILNRMLDYQATGFYVDVGAHHPMRFSNTYLFYRRGWKGINIDAQPGSMAPFRKFRPRDINLEVGVDIAKDFLLFHQFNEPALNTFDTEEANRKAKLPYRIIKQIMVPVRRLDSILDQYLPDGVNIDFMTVDAEGKDIGILKSNNWDRYRPRFVLAETLRTELTKISACPLVGFMKSVGYLPVAKAYNTTFFERITT